MDKIALLDLVEELDDRLVVLPWILLLNYQVGNVVKREVVLVHHALRTHSCSKLPQECRLKAEGSCLCLKQLFQILNFKNLVTRFGKLTKEVVSYFFLFLSALLGFMELVIVYDTRNDFLFFNIKVILRLLKGSSQSLSVLKGSSLKPFPFISALLPRV